MEKKKVRKLRTRSWKLVPWHACSSFIRDSAARLYSHISGHFENSNYSGIREVRYSDIR